MADTTQLPMNGNYSVQPAYLDTYNHAQAVVNNGPANFQQTQSATPSNAPSNDQKNDIPKDEVGWYFVEQYYTTMSRSPEKLHLFYSRRSQLVLGTEAESVPVAVGQKAINEKIRQLDFQDCKVRVLNVDSQASFENILTSVIGEISNKSEPSRKFVQTFVLAEQLNGYYVLNDIFRYLVDEEEVVPEEPAPAAVTPSSKQEVAQATPMQPVTETAPAAADTQVVNEATAERVDEKLNHADVNGDSKEEEQPKEPAPQSNGSGTKAEETQVPASVQPEEETRPDKPETPEPTPATSVDKGVTSAVVENRETKETAPPTAPKATVPKTWANIASKSAAAAAAVPAIPVAPPKVAPAPTASPSKPAAAAPASAPTPTPPAAPATAGATPSQPTSSTDGTGWQTAGDGRKSQARPGDEQNVLAYIKNVNEKIDANLLKQTLSRFGKLKYFDVSRAKNCAFIEFAEPAGYAAAVAANPHQIGTEQFYVEERRTRANAYGGNPNFGRSGSGRGRGQGRGGFQRDGGRGGFNPRGRGGNVAARGRNQSQAA